MSLAVIVAVEPICVDTPVISNSFTVVLDAEPASDVDAADGVVAFVRSIACGRLDDCPVNAKGPRGVLRQD